MKIQLILGLTLALFSSTLTSPVIPRGIRRDKSGLPLVQGGEDPDPVIRMKRDFVKQMMKDAWDDYVRWAWGNNELKPVSQTGQTGGIFGPAKIGATIVDSLDTLYIMELMDEYALARSFVADEIDFDVDAEVSVFEVNIRFVGGFLTAYAITQDQLYLDRAIEITNLLLPAFNSTTGIPYGWVNIQSGEVTDRVEAVLAEFGTLHLEFLYLSEVSGNPIYREKVMAIRSFLKDMEKPNNGQYWNFLDVETGEFTRNHISIGALGDSFYEYLLKAAIQLGDAEGRQMYDEAMNAFVDNGLVKVSPQSNLLYFAESEDGVIQDKVGHLACFAGGMLALGAHVDPNNTNAARDALFGREFTRTCRESYIRTSTGIGPEIFIFDATHEAVAGPNGGGDYILRPEVIESYFIMYRITGDSRYRDWAWEAATAIERYSKAGPGRGYSGIRNTNSPNPQHDDVQQTFFLAEVLKYLYLIFSTDDLISLDEWVFNTECHPLPIKATNPLY